MTTSLAKNFDQMVPLLHEARQAITAVVLGQDTVVDETLITLLSGGHGLFMGLPGLGKTLLVNTVATVMGLGTHRVQCTPDLMPADILGSEVLDEDPKTGKKSFRFIPGPVFTELLMVDEINRASPRTQSALLQAMQEHTVTVAGHTQPLPSPFHVLATQNPLDQEGTYPLPEAQLDRFLLQINVDYPTLEAERAMVVATTGQGLTTPKPLLKASHLLKAQTLVKHMPVGAQTVDAAMTLVRRARPTAQNPDRLITENLTWGPGPRAAQALVLAAKARALLEGRPAPSVDDVVALADAVLRHRMQLSFSGRAGGLTSAEIIRHVVKGL